MNLSILWS